MIDNEKFKKIREDFFNKKITTEDYKQLLIEVCNLNSYKDFYEFAEKEIKKLQDFIKNQEENINKKMENLINNQIKEK